MAKRKEPKLAGEALDDIASGYQTRQQRRAERDSSRASATARSDKKKESVMLRQVKNDWKDLTKTIEENINAYALLKTAVRGIISLYNTWQSIQQKMASGMGNLAMATGANIRQFREYRSQVQALSKSFVDLTDDVTGLGPAFEFFQELSVAIRDTALSSKNFNDRMLEASRGFGLTAEQTANLYRNLRAIEDISVTDFGADLLRFADQIGANAGTLARDFDAASDNVAQFGREGVNTFKRASMMANAFGFETNKIFEAMKKYDSFESAAGSVNQLNAMLGTTVSSLELMMEQDPTRRMEIIRNAIRDQGMTWDSMSRQQRQAVAESLNLSEQEAARVIQEGRSLRDLEKAREEAARRQQRRADMRQSNEEMMHQLLSRTSTVFQTISRQIEMLQNELSQALAPIFSILNEEMVSLVRQFRVWLSDAANSRKVQQIIEKIGKGIRWAAEKVAEFVRNFDSRKVEQFFDKLKPLWEMLKKVFDFAVEHPQIIAGIFIAAILPIGSLVTAIGSLASVLSPTAPFILAAAAFAGSWALAADNMERYSGEYRRNLNLSTNQLSAQDQSNRTATTANRVAQFDQLLGEGTIDDIMTGYGGRSAAMSPFRGAGMSLVRGAARVASGAGFTDASRSMNAYAFSEDVLASEAGMGLAQRVREILNSGAQSPQQIARSIEQARQRFASNPTDAREFDRNLRSQFGISENEDIGSSLLRKITALDPDYRPPRATSTPAAPAASGQSSVAPSAAPATDTTAAAPTNTAAMRVRGQQIQIVASDVVIDGRRVGEVMFEISRRT